MVVERALLIRLAGVGDTLMATSAAGFLKQYDPGMEIEFLALSGLEGLFTMIPEINRVHVMSFRGLPFRYHPGWHRLKRQLNRNRYPLAFLMETHPRFLPLLDHLHADRKIVFSEQEKSSPPGSDTGRYRLPGSLAGRVGRSSEAGDPTTSST